MLKLRSHIAVIIAKIIGIVLLVLAANMALEAYAIKLFTREDLFTISGLPRFSERSEESIGKSKKNIYVNVVNYPASFYIDKSNALKNAAYFKSVIKPIDTIRIALPKDQLAMLYIRSTIKLYELRLKKGKVIYSFPDAISREKKARMVLYIQAGICLFGALILLLLPKKYMGKE